MGSSSRSRSGERVPAYHCDRSHPRVALNKQLFEDVVRTYADRLMFSPPLVGAFEALAMDAYMKWRSTAPDAAAAIEQTVAALETERANVVRSFKAATCPAMHAALEEDMLRIDAVPNNCGHTVVLDLHGALFHHLSRRDSAQRSRKVLSYET